jgi:hypothetical protein
MSQERGGGGFEDRLRAIGLMLDDRHQRLISLTLVAEQTAMQVATASGEREEVTLSASDLAVLRCTARIRRGRGDATSPQEGFQGVMRALGRVIDEREARACRLQRHGDGFIVQVLKDEEAPA